MMGRQMAGTRPRILCRQGSSWPLKQLQINPAAGGCSYFNTTVRDV